MYIVSETINCIISHNVLIAKQFCTKSCKADSFQGRFLRSYSAGNILSKNIDTNEEKSNMISFTQIKVRLNEVIDEYLNV